MLKYQCDICGNQSKQAHNWMRIEHHYYSQVTRTDYHLYVRHVKEYAKIFKAFIENKLDTEE